MRNLNELQAQRFSLPLVTHLIISAMHLSLKKKKNKIGIEEDISSMWTCGEPGWSPGSSWVLKASIIKSSAFHDSSWKR